MREDYFKNKHQTQKATSSQGGRYCIKIYLLICKINAVYTTYLKIIPSTQPGN